MLPQGRIEDQRHDAADGDFHRAQVALDLDLVASQSLGCDQARQLVVVVEKEAIGSPSPAGDTVEQVVRLRGVRRRTKDDPGKGFPGQFQRAQGRGVDGQFGRVGGEQGGRQEPPVGQNEDRSLPRFDQLSPGHEVGCGKRRRFAGRVEAQLPLEIDAGQAGRELFAVHGYRHWRLGRG